MSRMTSDMTENVKLLSEAELLAVAGGSESETSVTYYKSSAEAVAQIKRGDGNGSRPGDE